MREGLREKVTFETTNEERELAMQIWRKNTPGRRNCQATDDRQQDARQVGETARKPCGWSRVSERERTAGPGVRRATVPRSFRPPGPFEGL